MFVQPNFGSGAPGRGPAGLNYLWAIFVDQEGTLWVSDGGNNRILWFRHASQLPNGFAADGVLGQPDFPHGSLAQVPPGWTCQWDCW